VGGARVAGTNGAGPRAFDATAGRCSKIGTKKDADVSDLTYPVLDAKE
jgi:hypothetical protein